MVIYRTYLPNEGSQEAVDIYPTILISYLILLSALFISFFIYDISARSSYLILVALLPLLLYLVLLLAWYVARRTGLDSLAQPSRVNSMSVGGDEMWRISTEI
jgi:hypothetical protein